MGITGTLPLRSPNHAVSLDFSHSRRSIFRCRECLLLPNPYPGSHPSTTFGSHRTLEIHILACAPQRLSVLTRLEIHVLHGIPLLLSVHTRVYADLSTSCTDFLNCGTFSSYPRVTLIICSSTSINAMDEEDECPTCPLCLEELDATDRAVKACQCGYQVSPNSKRKLYLYIRELI